MMLGDGAEDTLTVVLPPAWHPKRKPSIPQSFAGFTGTDTWETLTADVAEMKEKIITKTDNSRIHAIQRNVYKLSYNFLSMKEGSKGIP